MNIHWPQQNTTRIATTITTTAMTLTRTSILTTATTKQGQNPYLVYLELIQ